MLQWLFNPHANPKTSTCIWVAVSELSTFSFPSLSLPLRVDAVLKDVQVVSGCYGDDILSWVPSHVQDLLGEVQAIHTHISTTTLPSSVHTPGPQHRPGLAAFSPGLQCDASPCLPVKHPEEAIVGSCHDHAKKRRGEDNEVLNRKRQLDVIQQGSGKQEEEEKRGTILETGID